MDCESIGGGKSKGTEAAIAQVYLGHDGVEMEMEGSGAAKTRDG